MEKLQAASYKLQAGREAASLELRAASVEKLQAVSSSKVAFCCRKPQSEICNRQSAMVRPGYGPWFMNLPFYGIWQQSDLRYKPTVMAAMIIPTENTGTRRRLPRHIRIDMTPMVDLGFLLITFFIFTASMAETKALKLFMPADGEGSKIGNSTVLTALLGADNKLYLYEGDWKDALKNNKVVKTSYNVYTGAGSLIRAKQKALGPRREELMLLIKPTEGATYQNIINALDEVTINGVKKYVIVDPSEEEVAYASK
jgi:biopolymer transport protein ExbD